MKKLSDRTKFILLNLGATIILICCITFYVLSRLDNYTQHNQFIAVPAFHDMTAEEAGEVAIHARLRIQVVDSFYDENAKPGVILEQYPSDGSHVKENRLIHLTVNARNPEKIIFPNLQNAAYRQTLQTLETKGFTIGHILYAPSEFKNLVLGFRQDSREVMPGSLLKKGSRIDIVLGAGDGSNTVYTPSLTGKPLNEAIDIARKAYLNIGEIIPDGSIHNKNEQLSATVYQQYPTPNSMIQAGTPVSLYITLKKDKIAALDSLIITE